MDKIIIELNKTSPNTYKEFRIYLMKLCDNNITAFNKTEVSDYRIIRIFLIKFIEEVINVDFTDVLFYTKNIFDYNRNYNQLEKTSIFIIFKMKEINKINLNVF